MQSPRSPSLNRKSPLHGFLKHLNPRNVLRDSLHPILKRMGREKCGFHIFRRFRASWLRKNRVLWDLEKMWMGHAHKDLTDQYAEQLLEDVKYRRKWCERISPD